MKIKILITLLIASLTYSAGVSFLYWRLKSNPRVVAVTADLGKGLGQNAQLDELEKMTFLRQFLERYFQYDSNNFWQSQTSLAFLLSPDLREERIKEVSRLRNKIQEKSLSQNSSLLRIQKSPNGNFDVDLVLKLTEENSKVSELPTHLLLELETTERTMENPWGLWVKKLVFAPSRKYEVAPVKLHKGSPSLLTFPCALENIESTREDLLQTKITTLNVSELQLTALKELPEAIHLMATCKNKEFHFDVLASKEEATSFMAFNDSMAQERKTPSKDKIRNKDIYDKTIENVLGIKVDN